MAKVIKHRSKKLTKCPCLKAGSAKTIQINRGSMMAVELRESCARIHGATKIRILFFYPSTVGYSQEEEDRQLEKLHLALKRLPAGITGASANFRRWQLSPSMLLSA